MIIGEKKKKVWWGIYLFPLLLVGLLLYLLKAPSVEKRNIVQASPNVDQLVIQCGAEQTKGDHFINGDYQFEGANLQSSEMSHSGKYSVKLSGDNRFGFVNILKNPEPGATYKVEVWRKNKTRSLSYLAVSSIDSKVLYKQSDEPVVNTGDWWEKLEVYFTIPVHKSINQVKIFTYKTNDAGIVFFDDLKIEKLHTINEQISYDFKPKHVKLTIPLKAQRKLKEVRNRAFTKGLYIKEKSDLVKAFMTIDGEDKKVKLRYKGDWLDHMMSNSPSYRIQLQTDDSWNGLKTFSLQAPKTRASLYGWVYATFLRSEDILAPRLDYINVSVNIKEGKIYSFEEHFTKNLLENQLRREGPIMKLSENRFWDAYARTRKESHITPNSQTGSGNIQSAELIPFDLKKTLKNQTLYQQFLIAQNLLYQYKFDLRKPAEVFDLDKIAKHLAITDICLAQHGLAWHNLRFYYNPVTSLLEPIGYDGYSAIPKGHTEELYAINVYKKWSFEPLQKIFFDPEFMELYYHYLDKYSKQEYINSFFSKIETGLKAREEFIQIADKDYTFDPALIKLKAHRIQENILPFDKCLHSFKQKTEGDISFIKINNTNLLPVKIIGYGSKNKELEITLEQPIYVFPPKPNKTPNYTTVKVPKEVTVIYYQTPGLEPIFEQIISPWPTPRDKAPRQQLSSNTKLPESIIKDKNTYRISTGTYSFSEPIVIPKDNTLIIEKGTQLNFEKSGMIVSFGNLACKGTKEDPIIFKSSDKLSGSLVVLQSPKKSFLEYTIFEDQNTMKYKGWNLTGAVSFYESDVDISNCQFNSNHCEDALNIIRSNFEIKDCSFNNIFSDAFDADYCNGYISSTQFDQVGNDAIDFSTSKVIVENCIMTNIGDKGISGGENARITASDISIDKAVIGFAAKDQTKLYLRNITIANCSTGFAAFQKKPEYGPATISLGNYSESDTEHLFMIEKGSKLIL